VQAARQVGAHFQHQEMRQVRAAPHALPFVLAHPARDLNAAVGVAQLVFQGIGEGDRTADHALAHVARFAGVGPAGIDQVEALAREVAPEQDDFAPLLAAFPVAVIGGVVAEAEEDCERQSHQRERDRGERELLMPELAIGQGDGNREQGSDRQAFPDTGEDRAAHGQEQAQDGRAVADNHAGPRPGACVGGVRSVMLSKVRLRSAAGSRCA
jgi:hypothetical protein